MSSKAKPVCLFLLLVMILLNSGCGETVRGVAKDSMRIGRGIKTIFISE